MEHALLLLATGKLNIWQNIINIEIYSMGGSVATKLTQKIYE